MVALLMTLCQEKYGYETKKIQIRPGPDLQDHPAKAPVSMKMREATPPNSAAPHQTFGSREPEL